jgi:hypothetical protein
MDRAEDVSHGCFSPHRPWRLTRWPLLVAQTVDIYIDTEQGKRVRNDADPTLIPLPRFIQGDSFGINIYLLKQTKSYPVGIQSPSSPQLPYSVINNASMSCKVAIGVKDGLAGSLLYTQQFTWTPAANPAGQTYFTGVFPMNTTAIRDLINTGQTGQGWFEVEITDTNALPWTVLQELITIQAEVIDSNSVTVPPGETGLSVEVANQTYLRRVIDVFYLRDQKPGNTGYLAVYNYDGTLKVDNVTGDLPT